MSIFQKISERARGGKAAARWSGLAALAMIAAVAAAPELAAKPNPSPTYARLFGMVSIPLPNPAVLTKWTEVMKRAAAEHGGKSTAPCADKGACALSNYYNFVASLQGKDKRTQVEEINDYVNRVRYVPDDANYGSVDYWATPKEMFARGGDCEDYAIAKFLALKSLGFTNDDMRLVVLQDIKRGKAHAVLVVNVDGETLTLDNLLIKAVPTAWMTHYRPYYSVNIGNLWLHKAAA